jgi:hypothetical protein
MRYFPRAARRDAAPSRASVASKEAQLYNARMRRLVVSALVLGASLGCAETPPPAAPEPAPQPLVAAPVDVSPVPEPEDIVAVARWKNPNATLAGLSSCAAVPEAVTRANARLLVDRALAQAFRGGVDARPIAEIVAFDAPVDLVAALDTHSNLPNALMAFSIGLSSLEKAKDALQKAGELVEMAPGLFRVGATGQGELTCALGAAAGSAPARLICGKRDKDVTALGPYLARNLPVAEPPKSDVHAELRFQPVDARFGGVIRRFVGLLPNWVRNRTDDDPRFADAMEIAAAAVADEGAALIGDLDRVSVELGVDGASCLRAKASVQLRGTRSWLAGAMTDQSARSGPPPAIFWRAPIDADSASYGLATDTARYSGIWKALRQIVEAKLASAQVGSEAERRALTALVESPFGKDTNVVVASGHTHGLNKPAPGAKVSKEEAFDDVVRGYIGWTVLGVDEGSASAAKLLRDVASLLGKASVTDPLRKQLKAGQVPSGKLVKAPRELGPGALDLELGFEVAQKDAQKPASLAVHVLLMPDGQRTWIGVGANRADLVAHLLAARTGAPDSGTLAARPGLEPLRAGKSVGSGFLTLSMFTRGLEASLGNPALLRMINPRLAGSKEDLARALQSMPNQGTTPIFVLSGAAAEGAGPRSEIALQMQRGSFEDLGVVLLHGLKIAERTRADAP